MHYYMFSKPRDCISARYDARHKCVLDYFPEELRDIIFPVGRLDKDTEGLLILTDDGEMNARLLNPESHIEKTYFFYAVGDIDEKKLKEIGEGIKLYPTRDVISRPARLYIDGCTTLGEIRDRLTPCDLKRANRKPNIPVHYGRAIISEGKKHQVKRMLLYCGARIVYLKRIKVGDLMLDDSLGAGEYRPFTDSELEILKINKKEKESLV